MFRKRIGLVFYHRLTVTKLPGFIDLNPLKTTMLFTRMAVKYLTVDQIVGPVSFGKK
jgi:hypothetical protein